MIFFKGGAVCHSFIPGEYFLNIHISKFVRVGLGERERKITQNITKLNEYYALT